MSRITAPPDEKPSRCRRGAIAVLVRNRRYLVIRRAARLAKGGCWCFPGGHVEPGENSRSAIRRELREELGVDIVANERLGSIRIDGGRYILVVWRVECDVAVFRPNEAEIAEWHWLTPDELRSIEPGLQSNECVLKLLGV